MDHPFDSAYWDEVWSGAPGSGMRTSPANPHLVAEVRALKPGSALDAGCGAGAEAIWLAAHGWTVTAADIAPAALEAGRARASEAGVAEAIEWVRADLSTWQPGTTYDMVTTHYAHPEISQLAFYERLAGWVTPGGTLLVVGHLGGAHGHQHGHQHGHGHGSVGPPSEASVTAAAVTALLDPSQWDVVTADELQRSTAGPGGRLVTLHDVVVRARRRA
jgi:SAM-dependent methyltransferase